MAKKAIPKNPFKGRWRIVEMAQWDQNFVNEEVEGHFTFGPHNEGSFQFGYVQGQMDCRTGVRDGKPCIEFSWDGNDESTAAQGRGWAVLDGYELNGVICLHFGDESEFTAAK